MSPALVLVLLLGADPVASNPELAEQRAVALQLVELVQPESSYRNGPGRTGSRCPRTSGSG